MSHTIYAGKIAKRRNSTLQPTLTTSFDVLLKTPTSLHTPTFTISAASFDYNYLKWGDRYYFVTDVVSRNNSLWEVSAVCDVLATFKADILASTQFVSYSSYNPSIWLPDTRIPILNSTDINVSNGSVGILDPDGAYILGVVGYDSAALWEVTLTNIKDILGQITQWQQAFENEILSMTAGYNTVEDALQSVSQMVSESGLLGNAYSNAPQCIRSCIWTPITPINDGSGSNHIYLGSLDTHVVGKRVKATPTKALAPTSVSIPWHYSDWRRSTCEDVYLYLPLVGTIQLSGDSLTGVSSLSIDASGMATDGSICYNVLAGGEIIGSYSGSCAANYPIGINQQASLGEIAQSVISGVEKTVSAAIDSSISPVSIAGSAAGVAFEAAISAYNSLDVAKSTHISCVGGAGGGAGAGLDLAVHCYTVAHPTAINPADMAATMGLPTMLPMSLSTLTGYCQCANAHVGADGAEAQELTEIDTYLNSGFYIE